MKKQLLIASTLIAIVTACAKKSVEEIAPAPVVTPLPAPAPGTPPVVVAKVKYTTDIKTIMDTKCAVSGCHEVNGVSPNLTNYNDVKGNITTILNRMNMGQGTGSFMPQGGAKTQTDIDKVTKWQTDGLLEQ